MTGPCPSNKARSSKTRKKSPRYVPEHTPQTHLKQHFASLGQLGAESQENRHDPCILANTGHSETRRFRFFNFSRVASPFLTTPSELTPFLNPQLDARPNRPVPKSRRPACPGYINSPAKHPTEVTSAVDPRPPAGLCRSSKRDQSREQTVLPRFPGELPQKGAPGTACPSLLLDAPTRADKPSLPPCQQLL